MPVLAPIAAGWLLGLLAGTLVLPPEGAAVWRAALGLFALTGAVVGVAVGTREARADFLTLRSERWARIAPYVLGVCALAAGLATGRRSPAPPVPPEGLARMEGEVLSVRRSRYGPSSRVRVTHGARIEDEAPLPEDVHIRVRGRALPRGARVRLLARLAPEPRFRNPSPHPRWPTGPPVVATAHVPDRARVRVVEASAWRAAVESARDHVRAAIRHTLPAEASGFARALVLGERGAVASGDQDAVRNAGLAHVLAVSGLHVALVAGLVVLGLRRLLVYVPVIGERYDARRVAAGLGIPIAFGYAVFAGGPPSAWRAAVTASLAWVLIAAGRKPRGASVAAAAVLVLATAHPSRASEPAFLLSVVAVASILTASVDPRETGWIRAAAIISVRATIATAPLVAWWFGNVPVAGLVANVVVVPLASLALVPLAVAHALLASTVSPLAAASGALFSTIASAFVTACGLFARVPLGHDLPPPSVFQGIVLGVGAMAVLLARPWRWRLAIVGATVGALVAGELHLRAREQPTGVLRVTSVDVGQGDATLIDFPDGRAMLVDAGGTPFGGPDPGTRALLPLLRARRRARLDVVVITHGHPDHFQGLEALLGRVEIGEVWATEQAEVEQPNGPTAKMLDRLRKEGVAIRRPASVCGEAHRYGKANVHVLWPCPAYDPGYGPNDNSLVLRVDMGRRSLLLAGDVEADAEAKLVHMDLPLAADVLKVPHHGSRTSSTDAFLDAVQPQLALVSCGMVNRFGHPNREVLARLRQRGVRIARTDTHGGVVVTTNGRWLRAKTWEGAHWDWPARTPSALHRPRRERIRSSGRGRARVVGGLGRDPDFAHRGGPGLQTEQPQNLGGARASASASNPP